MKKLVSLLGLVLLAASLSGQPGRVPSPKNLPPSEHGEFTFVRTIYDSPFRGRRGGSWATDFPAADYHFILGIRYWSGANLDISARPEQLQIDDERLFNYPLLYFVESGYMELSDREASKLREYVLRGGFLGVD